MAAAPATADISKQWTPPFSRIISNLDNNTFVNVCFYYLEPTSDHSKVILGNNDHNIYFFNSFKLEFWKIGQ